MMGIQQIIVGKSNSPEITLGKYHCGRGEHKHNIVFSKSWQENCIYTLKIIMGENIGKSFKLWITEDSDPCKVTTYFKSWGDQEH